MSKSLEMVLSEDEGFRELWAEDSYTLEELQDYGLSDVSVDITLRTTDLASSILESQMRNLFLKLANDK